MRQRQKRYLTLFSLLLLLLTLPLNHPQAATKTALKEYSFGQKQKFKVGFDGREIIVYIRPRPGEGMFRFASWTLKDWRNNYQKIKAYNQNKDLQKNTYVRFPFSALNDNMQSLVLQTLFNHDTSEEQGWTHRVLYPGETISLIAGIFARKGISSSHLIKHNKLERDGRVLKIGDVITIPWDWVRKELHLVPVNIKKPLVVKPDQFGKPHAYYKIAKGESLYSSVVIRFTARTLAEDVNKMARELIALNRIKDEHLIPVGLEIKIPLEWISEEYLEKDTPRPSLPDVEEEIDKEPIKADQPIHVIIDPGHGGRDPGAIYGSKNSKQRIFEDEIVYDISLRLSEILKTKNIKVHLTLQDPNQSKPISTLPIRKDDDERVMVSPPYKVSHVNVGINMRIFLVNDIYQNLIRKKVPKSNILLISLHGDALHKSLEGATVYYPDARLRSGLFTKSHKVYRKRKEFRRKIRFPIRDNSRSAKMSSNFGKQVIRSFKNAGLKTHKSFAVRGYYYRKGSKTLPGILRYSKIPTSVLVEVGNLNNVSDRAGLRTAEHRQKIAHALADSITTGFQKS